METFLKAIVERQEKLNLNLDITGVELCLDEAKKAMRYGTNVECQDFFAFYRDKVTGKSNYDAIVGIHHLSAIRLDENREILHFFT